MLRLPFRPSDWCQSVESPAHKNTLPSATRRLTSCQARPSGWHRALRRWCLLALLILGSAAGEAGAQSVLTALEQEIASLIRQARPSVVTVLTVMESRESGGGLFRLFGARKEAKREVKVGTGLILSSDGFVLTKESVVRDASRVEISLDDGSLYAAELVAQDSAHGVALLKIQASDLKPARIGSDESLHAGSWIAVIGNALGVPQAVSVGVVSAMQSDRRIQISATVDPGSNGSPVFDTQADAIGMVIGRIGLEPEASSSSFLGNTVLVQSLDELLPFVRTAIASYYAEHGWIGIKVIMEADKDDGQPQPRILQVMEASPAWQAGLQEGDILLEFAGKRVSSPAALGELVSAAKPGQEVRVKIKRLEQEHAFNVRIGRRAAVALGELISHREEQIAPAESLPGMFFKKETPRFEPGSLEHRLEVLERELKMLQNQSLKQKKN